MVLKNFKPVLFTVAFVFLSFDTPVFASVFYKFDVVAQPGEFDRIKDSVSINDKGMVTFIGVKSGPPRQDVYMGDGLTPFTVLSSQVGGITYDSGVQINNSNQVVVRWSSGLNSTIRVYDGDNPGNYTTIVRGDGTGNGGTFARPAPFLSVFSYPSLSNIPSTSLDPYVVFSALDDINFVLSTPIIFDDAEMIGGGKKTNYHIKEDLEIPLRPRIADDGHIVVRGGIYGSDQDPILVYSNDFQQETVIATSSDFIRLGRSPGISDDGKVVAFAGQTGDGEGVFISIDDGSGFGNPIPIVGRVRDIGNTAELGYGDGDGDNALKLLLETFDLDSRVGVVRLDLGDVGFRDDAVVVSFVATPNSASIYNTHASKPLTFSREQGIWTVRIDFDRPRDGSGFPDFNIHINSPIPVVQINDEIQTSSGSFQVSHLEVNDPLALAAEDADGIRTQRRGDHRVAFLASNGTTEMVVRAEHLDSDQDGLLDHWESSGGGIDIDQDGAVDLDLSALGATTTTRDLFLEIDWLKDRTSGSYKSPYSFKPLRDVTLTVTDMLLTAEALTDTRYGIKSDGSTPDDIPAVIVAHIDAGPGTDIYGDSLSFNMPYLYEGGEEIDHVDVVYFGKPNKPSLQGLGSLTSRSFHDIKNNFFSTTDKGAREFAFHYMVIADFIYLMGFDVTKNEFIPDNDAPFVETVATATSNTLTAIGTPFGTHKLSGNSVMIITSGNFSDGQVRKIDSNTSSTLTLKDPWSTIPDTNSEFVLLDSLIGIGEVGNKEGKKDLSYWTRPGNDCILGLGSMNISSILSVPSLLFIHFAGTQNEQISTILHELGHNMGLIHGGIDHENYNPFYWSIMNYAYSKGQCTDTTLIKICMNGGFCFSEGHCLQFFLDYSRPGDPTKFVDWENLRMDVFNTGHLIGNSYGIDSGGLEIELEEIGIAEIEDIYGPTDVVGPVVAINSPEAGASILTTQDMTVNVTATDNVEIGKVTISFDIDGDGNVDGPGEVISAINTSGDTYDATFKNIFGPDGQRTIKVVAKDLEMIPGIAYGTVTVTASLGGTVTPVITPTPSPIPTLTTTPTAVATPTPLVTLTPEITPTPTPQVTPTPVPTVEPTPTLVPTPTPYPTPRITPSPAPTGTPTAITLLYFEAKAGDKGNVALTWETAMEVDNAGFNLYRARHENGAYTKINDMLIPAQGDAVSGASYSYVDTPGKGTFYYKLEDVDYYGVSTMHGTEKVRVRSDDATIKKSKKQKRK